MYYVRHFPLLEVDMNGNLLQTEPPANVQTGYMSTNTFYRCLLFTYSVELSERNVGK